MRFVLSTESLPAYHDNMLIVRMRKDFVHAPLRSAVTATLEASRGMRMSGAEADVARTASVASAAISELLPTTPGFTALSQFERAGMIKRVVPLDRGQSQVARQAGWPPSSVMAAASMIGEARPARRMGGTSIIELEEGRDVEGLRVALANDPGVEGVSRVPRRYLVARPSKRRPTRARSTASGAAIAATPPKPSLMWNLRKIRWAEARAKKGFIDANSISVAVLDTGIDGRHPDLAGRISNYVYDSIDLLRPSSAQDVIGHGTHVAGTIGAIINNDLGINGICSCKMHIWKIFDDEPDYMRTATGGEYVYYVNPIMYRRALADCLESEIDVINLSIGGSGEPDLEEKRLFEALLASGTSVIAAMGNERQHGSPTSYPAAISGVIAVGATGLDDAVTSFSNRGSHITLSAPGKAIWSTLPTYPGQTGFEAVIGANGQPRQGKPFRRETNYDAWDGTSMAAPHVAGASALYFARRKEKLPPATVQRALMDSADKVPGMGRVAHHPDYGAGRLNLDKLLSG